MALISLRQLLDHAAENGYGLPAFNVNNMEQVKAIMEAAAAVDSPVILQGSAGARSYAGEPFLRHLILAAIEMYPQIPICMHQDHGATPDICFRSIQSGFSSVMMDGSLGTDGKTPSTYEYNVATAAKVSELAHACGVSVEGELGCLGSLVLVHADRNLRIHFDRGQDQVAQEGLAGVGTRTGRTLQADRGIDRGGGFHDGLDLFHVVDVERRQAVAVFGGVVQQLTQ